MTSFWPIIFWVFVIGSITFLLGWIGLKQRNLGALLAFGCSSFLLLQSIASFLPLLFNQYSFLSSEAYSSLNDFLYSPLSKIMAAVASTGFGIGFLLFAFSLEKLRPPESD